MHRLTRTRLALVVLAGALAAGCAYNPLPDYAPKIRAMEVQVIVPRGPYVDIGSNTGGGGVIGFAAQMVAAGSTGDVKKKLADSLDQVASAQHIQSIIQTDLSAGQAASGLPFPLSSQPGRADARLEITISGYGISAADLGSEAYYLLRAHARLVYLPESKVLWHEVWTFDTPIKRSDLGYDPVSQIATGTMTVSALNKVSKAQLAKIFDRMAHGVGGSVAADLRRASAR